MSTPAANMSVWVGDKLVCLKIAGRANFHASVDFKTVVHGLRIQGHGCFVLDLTDCLLMDSTFLGVLSGLGLKFSQSGNGQAGARLELLNPNPRISDLLENLGIAHLFRVVTGPPLSVERLALLDRQPCHPDRTEITRTCLEAHQTLMDINPGNIPKFKDVTQFLAEDLRKMEQEATQKNPPGGAQGDGAAKTD